MTKSETIIKHLKKKYIILVRNKNPTTEVFFIKPNLD